MRTTVTLDPDVAAKVKRIAHERGISFKDALNSLLRMGLGEERRPARRFRVAARPLGLRRGIELDKALRAATSLEDEEIIRKLELNK